MPPKKSPTRSFQEDLDEDLKDPKFKKLYEKEKLKLDIELLLRKVITRETHKGSYRRVIVQTVEAIMRSVDMPSKPPTRSVMRNIEKEFGKDFGVNRIPNVSARSEKGLRHADQEDMTTPIPDDIKRQAEELVKGFRPDNWTHVTRQDVFDLLTHALLTAQEKVAEEVCRAVEDRLPLIMEEDIGREPHQIPADRTPAQAADEAYNFAVKKLRAAAKSAAEKHKREV